MHIEKRSSQMTWRFKLGLTCGVFGAAWAASACGADVGPVADSTDSAELAEEALWLGQADARERRARHAFWAYWRHVLLHRDHEADPPSCRDGSRDRGEACDDDGYPDAGDRSTPDDEKPAPDDDQSRSGGDASPPEDDPSTPDTPGPAPDMRSNPGGARPAGDVRTNYVQCGALSCGPSTAGCCAMTLECASASRACSTPGPIFDCDGPEDCTRPGERCWGGLVAPLCASIGPYLKCHTAADCDLARPVCNSAGNCVD